MATASLPEPTVLAHAKERLFDSSDGADTYAVCDTQFAAEAWLSGRPIPEAVRERLAPFNHVRVGSGYPDLVGAGVPDADLLAVERLGDRPPLVAVEAKGHTDDGTVDVERGIVQAHDRLGGANVAYVAAPAESISPSARTLAGELNVGVLGVAADGQVEPIERPRVVGHRSDDDATAIRFQASARGVTDDSFGLNHPKNYLGYPIALADPGDTGAAMESHVVGAVGDARRGAAALGLIEERPHRTDLAPLGEEVVRFSLSRYGSTGAALEALGEFRRSRSCFYELAPEWGLLARRVVWTYPATRLLVAELQAMFDEGIESPSLVELVEWLFVQHSTFAIELFVRGTGDARGRVLGGSGELRTDALEDGDVYHAPTVFQLKAMLYHAGVVTERGAEPTRLDPTTDRWALREPVVVSKNGGCGAGGATDRG
ncbi:uncharacterized protein Nmlp_1576 [Natronomonas moolapensis 8.8.11]|uniref:Uncharacterized protein n=1 Tax=Natronomonas moolapensis (strain DSM 18674 / CECT 7526 / JCM 14361 / 8.8.11) TaxID=268739 RepID=M1XP48_NATM8|nr:hypothetical protein [Natronomonas moolapensis]CCQ35775.1 uncharacterized protein Nmlp_1576 [Natronomonas moolapensis 8.8.11]